MDNKIKTQNKMGSMPIFKLLVTMAMPPMISMFFQYSYNVIDCMFVSWLNKDALTAISLAFPIQNFMLSVAIGAGVGCNTLISRKLGEEKQDEANNIVSHSLILSFILAFCFMLIGLTSLKPFFRLFTSSEEIFEMSLIYTRIVTIISYGCIIHIMIQKIVQATGNTVYPMIFQIIGVLVNCILDPILIFGLFGFPKMGVAGAAIATIIGQFISTILAFYVLIFLKLHVKIKIKGFKFEIKIFKDILVTGFPSLVMNALGAFQVLFVNLVLIPFSDLAVAMFGIYFKLQTLAYMIVNGLIQGALPIMSYNYGARKEKRLFDTLKISLIVSVTVLLTITIIFFTFPGQTLKLFAASDDMLNMGITCIRTISIGYIFAAFGFMFASFFQAVRYIKSSLLINLLRQMILLFPLILILSKQFEINGVWYAFPISEILTAIISTIMFFKFKDKIY